MTHIILCMIVKNEAAVIERCLKHALPIIDAACICDTGSTDGTQNLVESVLGEAGIPHRVHQHEWVNFGLNRGRSFAEARDVAGERGWDLTRSYALFIDADMVLRLADGFDKASLDGDGYNLQQQHGTLVYSNLRLARLSLDWRSIGATHEYWSADGAGSIEFLDTLWIEDLGDGGSKGDKNERDMRLLEAELKEQPDNPRTQFYLAQTYFEAGRFEDARGHYIRRSQVGGWEEEAWYATYRAAVCSVHLDEWERGAGELLSAWERRPRRAESLYMLAHFARKRRASHTAMLAAERALKVSYPGDDRLFVDQRAYREGPIEEISISAYYTGQKARGAAACDALLHHRATPPSVRNLAARNSAHYAEPLATEETARRVNIPIELLGTTFSASTGSIHPTPSGYALVNRLVSYYQRAAATFLPRDPNGKYFTRNVWVEFDRDLKVRSTALVDDTLAEQQALVPTSEARICGVEDIRLIRWNEDWWFTGGSSQFNVQHRPRIVLGRLSPEGTRIEHIVLLRYDGEQAYEKNWTPFIFDGRLLILYSFDPLVILEADPATGICREIHRSLPPVELRRYRGSSQLMRAGDRYIGIIHEVATSGDGRYYLHRFVEMDRAFHITRASRLFTFWHRGVEYCCGLCVSHAGDEVIVSFSFDERESWLLNLPRSQVEEMLIPIDHLAFIDPPPDDVAAGPGWLRLPSLEGSQPNRQDEALLNGPVRTARHSSRPPRRRLWAPRRRRGPGSG
jgi:glycosyltransferase involved in cell wall biosynthesis